MRHQRLTSQCNTMQHYGGTDFTANWSSGRMRTTSLKGIKTQHMNLNFNYIVTMIEFFFLNETIFNMYDIFSLTARSRLIWLLNLILNILMTGSRLYTPWVLFWLMCLWAAMLPMIHKPTLLRSPFSLFGHTEEVVGALKDALLSVRKNDKICLLGWILTLLQSLSEFSGF